MRPLERNRLDGRMILKMDLQEVGWGCMSRIGLTQVRDWWRTLANAVMNLRVP
jgi:hypothetical protein